MLLLSVDCRAFLKISPSLSCLSGVTQWFLSPTATVTDDCVSLSVAPFLPHIPHWYPFSLSHSTVIVIVMGHSCSESLLEDALSPVRHLLLLRQWELAGSSLSVARWEEVTLASGCSGVLPLACQMSAPQCGAEQRGNLGDWYLWGSLCRGVLAWEVPAGIGLRHSGSPRAPGGTLGTYAHLCHRLVALHQRPLLVCQARLGNRQSDVPGKLNQPNMISHCCCVVEGFHSLIQVAFCVVNWYMDFSALRCLNMLSCCWKNGARSFNNLVSWVRFVQLG